MQAELRETLPGRPNVIGRLFRNDDYPWLVFEGHLDTVPAPADLVPRLSNGRLTGRGACDTKGGIAAALHAMECLRGVADLKTNIEFAGTIDEEVAYQGVLGYLQDTPPRDGAIVIEPTSLSPVIAHTGVLRGRLSARGRAAHSSTPALGINAIDTIVDSLPTLTRWAHDRAPNMHPLTGATAFSITTIRGGHAINMIPDDCSVEFDWRLHPSDDPAQALAALGARLEAAPASLELTEVLQDSGFALPSDSPLALAAQAACLKITGRGEMRGMRAGTDASKFAHRGVPTVVIGPGSIEQAHTRDEWVRLDELTKAADIFIELSVTADRYLSAHEHASGAGSVKR